MIKNELIKRIISSLILITLLSYFVYEGAFFFNIFLIICFFISIKEWFGLTKKKLFRLLGVIFLLLSFYCVFLLRNEFQNFSTLLFVLLICIGTDIGGYIFGNIFRGPKLTQISPNKTYSGVLGGYVFSILIIYLYLNSDLSSNLFLFSIEILIFVFFVSTISQLGDLFISYFKRISKIKDTGNLIPGHGGLLDRIDGMIFAFPFSYYLISLNILNIN
tara:strand:- start:610 stop:1263 length:654 start_codon:yes stop_codon:yes gene_type:complete